MNLQPRSRLNLLTTGGFGDYALIDSGDGRKLERFGDIVVDRPEAQAIWGRALGKGAWAKAHAVFSASGEDDEKGQWRVDRKVPESWPVGLGPAKVLCKLQGLWHLGLFPEQRPHWDWMVERIGLITGEPPRVLNLFGYTGAASLLAAAAGAHVTHVDASKKAVAWARENQAASQLNDAPIRWIIDDAAKFVAREVRRGKSYHVMLIDPPKFGRGPKGERWDLFTSLPPLLYDCAQLVAPGPTAVVLTSYAIRASALSFEQLMRERLRKRGGRFDSGELVILPKAGGNGVPTSLYTRWVGDNELSSA